MNEIRKKRIEKGINQLDLAKVVGVSAASISYYERGEKRPSMVNAFKIANALDTTVDELFFHNAETRVLEGGDSID